VRINLSGFLPSLAKYILLEKLNTQLNKMAKAPKPGPPGMRPAYMRDPYHRYDSAIEDDYDSYGSGLSESDYATEDEPQDRSRQRQPRHRGVSPEPITKQQKYQQKPTKAPFNLREYRNLQSWDVTRLKTELDSIGLYCDDFEKNTEAPPLQVSAELIEANIRSVCREFTTLAYHKNVQDRSQRLYLCRGLSDQLYRLFALMAIERQYECTVCGDKKRGSRFPTSMTKNCSHSVKTCKSCVRTWATSQLDSNGWNKIRCPECPELMGKSDMRSLATTATYERYVT
jgi:hypothetical protein